MDVGIPSALHEADRSLFLQINEPHYEIFNQLMVLATLYGREAVWTVAAVLLFFGGKQGRKAAVVMGLTMAALIPLGTVAKEIVGRPRPLIPADDFVMAPDNSPSFPSGHALLVSAGAAIMLTLYRDSPRQTAISLAMSAEAAIVCISRIYVGAHTPLDVAGGILLGVAVAFLFVAISERLDKMLVMPISGRLEAAVQRLAR